MSCLTRVFIAVLLLSCAACGQVVYDLPKLINESELVAAVRVETVVPIGSGMVELSGTKIATRLRKASLHVERVLKGDAGVEHVDVPYTLLYSPAGWAGGVPRGYSIIDTLRLGSWRIVFLKNCGQSYCFTDGSYLSLVAADSPALAEQSDTLGLIIGELAGVLQAGNRDEQDKVSAAWQLKVTESPVALRALKSALRYSDDGRVKCTILGGILWHKDTSVLPQATAEIYGEADRECKENLISAVTRAISPPQSIRVLRNAFVLSDADVRGHAAQALYQTNSQLAIPVLLRGLDDPDRRVVFDVMQGLGLLTGEEQWRPKTSDEGAAWQACVAHWQEFRRNWNGTHAPARIH